MGYARIKGYVANPTKRELKVELEFIVDTGAIYTVIPCSIAERLGLKEVGKRKFKIANGDVVEYPVAEAYVIIGEEGVTSLVVLGPEEAPPLLGATTLELLGLQVDPVTKELKPLELFLL